MSDCFENDPGRPWEILIRMFNPERFECRESVSAVFEEDFEFI